MVILFAQTATIHQITEEFPARGDFKSTDTALGSHDIDSRRGGHGAGSSLPMSDEVSLLDIRHSSFLIPHSSFLIPRNHTVNPLAKYGMHWQ